MFALVKFGRTYYFRLRVPVDLRKHFPSGEIVRSLRTERYQQAKSLVCSKLGEVEKLFMTLRANVLTDEMIQKVVAQYLNVRVSSFDKGREADYSSFDHEANGGYESHEGWHKYLSETFMSTDEGYAIWLRVQQIMIDANKKQLGRGNATGVPDIQFTAEGVINSLAINTDKNSPEYRKLCTELLKADIKAETVIMEHLKGNFETDYDIKQRVVKERKTLSHSLSELIVAYKRANGGEGYRGKLKEKMDKITECFRLESGKDNILLSEITYDLTERVGHRLAKYPLYRGTRYAGKTLQEINIMPGVETTGETTLKEELGVLNSLYKFAISKLEGLQKNFADGLSKVVIVKRSKKKASSAKDIFRYADIQEIVRVLGEFKAKGEFEKNPHLLYITLIGLYSGARINEICQLTVDDIVLIDGIQCFKHMEEESSTKSLKNSNSIRINPVHPMLVECGLLTFRDAQKVKGFTGIWEGSKNHSCDYYEKQKNCSQYVGKWWNRTFKAKLNLSNAEKQTFHSTRHTFINWFKQNVRPLDYEARNALSGHLDKDDIAAMSLQGYDSDSEGEVTYTKDLNVIRQMELLKQLDYGIDLIPLKII